MRKLALLCLFAPFVCAGVRADSGFRTTFEVSVLDANGTHTVHTAYAVRSGEPFVEVLQNYELRFEPSFDEVGGYQLMFRIANAPKSDGPMKIPSSHRFEGRIGVPLEFKIDTKFAQVDAAIVFSQVDY